MIQVAEFMQKHRACVSGRKWAITECETMSDVWAAARPDWLVWVATRPGVLDEKTLRLFACFCARQNWDKLTEPRSRSAVETAERYAAGDATDKELEGAQAAAWDAAWAAAEAATGAARAAEAAADAAWAAALDSEEAAGAAQAEWLRENANPNFEL